MLKDNILYAFKQLFPKGRAFRVPDGGDLENFLKALIGDSGVASSLTQVNLDEMNIMDVLIPDNANFTLADAHDWYRRLGLYDTGTITLSNMKLAILQKMSWAINASNQQTATYIQAQLHAAGFTSCNVFKNTFGSGGEAIDPGAYISESLEPCVCGEIQSGQSQFGQNATNGYSFTKIANYIEESKDIGVVITNYRSTFYVATAISGGTITYATVPTAQKQQFRQLLIQLKAQQLVGLLFINYT